MSSVLASACAFRASSSAPRSRCVRFPRGAHDPQRPAVPYLPELCVYRLMSCGGERRSAVLSTRRAGRREGHEKKHCTAPRGTSASTARAGTPRALRRSIPCRSSASAAAKRATGSRRARSCPSASRVDFPATSRATAPPKPPCAGGVNALPQKGFDRASVGGRERPREGANGRASERARGDPGSRSWRAARCVCMRAAALMRVPLRHRDPDARA
ncbi:hypothetical protein B0H17DRAFT_1338877 [Mycena rosella]|uniref:Uncharacterized protein n=1 Tax=Mycena rosella TaxID=1033263 RepID=A0AAD7CGW4_MYCRO|nr:hypothetical protein B0H17DRAFT_1338877 [Mycena rosella]